MPAPPIADRTRDSLEQRRSGARASLGHHLGIGTGPGAERRRDPRKDRPILTDRARPHRRLKLREDDTERLGDRPVRQGRARERHAAPTHRREALRSRRLQHGLGKPRLADPGLAPDERDRHPALGSARQVLSRGLELPVAADQYRTHLAAAHPADRARPAAHRLDPSGLSIARVRYAAARATAIRQRVATAVLVRIGRTRDDGLVATSHHRRDRVPKWARAARVNGNERLHRGPDGARAAG